MNRAFAGPLFPGSGVRQVVWTTSLPGHTPIWWQWHMPGDSILGPLPPLIVPAPHLTSGNYLEQCGPQKNAHLDTICQNEINSAIASYYLKTSIVIWQDNIMTADSQKIWGLDFLMSLYYSFHFSSNSFLFCYKSIILQPVRNKKH